MTLKGREEVLSAIDKFLAVWKEKNFQYFMENRERVKRLKRYDTHFSKELCDLYNFTPSRFYNRKVKDMESEQFFYNEFIDRLFERHNLTMSKDQFKDEVKKYVKAQQTVERISDQITQRLVTSSLSEAETYLHKYLDREVESRKDIFVESIENAGGDMVSLYKLEFGEDSLLNGVISCVNADVKVETIGAGGYNIQRFHYRLLCHALKDRVNPNISEQLKNFVAPKKKSNAEKVQVKIDEYILAQGLRLDAKVKEDYKMAIRRKDRSISREESEEIVEQAIKSGELKNRGSVIWERIKEFGYEKLISESGYEKYLDGIGYPIFKKEFDADLDFVWAMSYAYLVKKDESLAYNKRIQLWWNIEGTDSMERVKEISVKRGLAEFEQLVPLMAKKGKFTHYGEPTKEELDEKAKNDNKSKFAKYEPSTEEEIAKIGLSDYEKNMMKYSIDHVHEYEEQGDYRGIKVWERMLEYNLHQQLLDLGYKVYFKTQFYPYFYKDYGNERFVISPMEAYTLEDFHSTTNARFHRMYFVSKGADKVSDVEAVARGREDKLEFKVMAEVMNLRKKLAHYISNPKTEKVTEVKIHGLTFTREQYEAVRHYLFTTLSPHRYDRTRKILERFRDFQYKKLFIQDYKMKEYVFEVDNAVVPMYMGNLGSKLMFLISYQHIFIYTPEKIILVSDLVSAEYTLQNLESIINKLEVPNETKLALTTVLNLNNLRKTSKLNPYG